MPATINGCGTTYYGKRHLHTREGNCGACRRHVHLGSYDTTLWFVLAFIPIVPLGRKRIIDYCPVCHRHRVLSLSQWNQLRTENCARALAAYREDPGDIDRIRDVIGAFAAYHNTIGLKEFAEEFRKQQSGNVEGLCRIGLVQTYFHQYEDAEATLRLALRSAPQNEAVKEGLAEVLIRLLRPEEAEPLLAHVRRSGDPGKAWLLMLLATGWQAKGEHQRALNALDQCRTLAPQMQERKDYRKSRKLSEKNRDRHKPIRAKAQALTGGQTHEGSNAGGRIAFVVPVILAIAALSWYLFTAIHLGRHREIHLINGLSKPYDVTINDGVRITLTPGSPVVASVKEGDLRILVISDDYRIDPFTERVHTNFFERPFIDPIFALNPDGVALYEYQRATYMEKNPPPTKYTVYTSHRIDKFSDIDFPFQPLPLSIKLGKDEARTRSSIEAVGGRADWGRSLEVGIALDQFRDDVNAADRLSFFLKRLSHEPNRIDIAKELEKAVDAPEKVTELIRPLLDRRPVNVELHRYYQTRMHLMGRADEARAEYIQLYEDNPQDPGVKYLLARLTEDPREGMRLTREAIAGERPCAYAFNSLAWHHWQHARFPEALEMAAKAYAIDPESAAFRDAYVEMCLASGEFEKAASAEKQALGIDLTDFVAMEGLAYALASLGRKQEALQASSPGIRILGNKYAPAATDGLGDLIASEMELATLTPEQIIAMKHQHPEEESFEVSLWDDDFEKAVQVADGDSPIDCALLAVALHQHGDRVRSAEYLDKFLTMIAEGAAEDKVFAGYILTGSDLPTEDLLEASHPGVLTKYSYLVLGEFQPRHRKVAWEIARKLNYDHRDCYAITEKLIGRQ